jgi:hypothetical protein
MLFKDTLKPFQVDQVVPKTVHTHHGTAHQAQDA